MSDAAVQNVEFADQSARDFASYEVEFDKWHSPQPSPTSRHCKKHPEGCSAYCTEYDARKAIVDKVQFGVGLIPRTELRDVVRISAAWFQPLLVGESIRNEMYRTKFVLGTGEIVTTKDVLDRYRVDEI